MKLKKFTLTSILIKLISANQNQTDETTYNDILKDLGLDNDDSNEHRNPPLFTFRSAPNTPNPIPNNHVAMIKDFVRYEMLQNAQRQRGRTTAGLRPTSTSRSSGMFTGFFNLKYLYYGYGCYCNFGAENWQISKGHPTNNHPPACHRALRSRVYLARTCCNE